MDNEEKMGITGEWLIIKIEEIETEIDILNAKKKLLQNQHEKMSEVLDRIKNNDIDSKTRKYLDTIYVHLQSHNNQSN